MDSKIDIVVPDTNQPNIIENLSKKHYNPVDRNARVDQN